MPQTIAGTTFYTVKEAAVELNVTVQTIRNNLKAGRLKGYRMGGHLILITEEQIKEGIRDYKPRPKRPKQEK